MKDIEGEIVIARPVEEVFDFVADERNELAYNPNMTHAEQVTEGPLGTGTRFVTTVRVLGRPLEMRVEYTAYDRPARLSSVTHMATAEVSGTLTFEPHQTGTRLRWSWHLRPRGTMKFLAPVLIPVGRRQEKAIWTGLKWYLEATPQRP